MASSNDMITMEPWTFRTSFADTWLSEAFTRETETLTKALENSFSSQVDNVSSDFITTSVQTTTPTVSGGSENENVAVSRRRNGVGGGVAAGKITKRKSRASKRATTTFITADPSNFRQMVQQVTGVRLGENGQLEVAPLLKPEPYRPNYRMLQPGGCLPTLDTSAFFLDQTHQQQQQQQLVGAASEMFPQAAAVSVPPPSMVVGDGGSASTFDFDSFCSFPTLESWKAM